MIEYCKNCGSRLDKTGDQPELSICSQCHTMLEYLSQVINHDSKDTAHPRAMHYSLRNSDDESLSKAECEYAVDAANRIAELKAELLKQERSEERCIAQRDVAEDAADMLVSEVCRIYEQDFGEHSGWNSPWDNAIEYLSAAPKIADLEAENARLREALSRRVKLADHDEACFCSSMPGLPRGVRDDNCTCSIRDDMSLLSPTDESEVNDA